MLRQGSAAQPYALVVTTWNNAATLARCLDSVPGAAEKIVLDSGSTDTTRSIAEACGARWVVEAFRGYGPQKQAAVDLARYDWVLLLDADEFLSAELAAEIDALMAAGPAQMAYQLRRREQLFWRWQHPWTKPIGAIRLFRRDLAAFAGGAVHAAVVSRAPVGLLRAPLMHLGEVDLHHKVERINAYSSGMVPERRLSRQLAGRRPGRVLLFLKMLLYPSWAFWREYLLRRQFLNGWAGFMAARCSAFYAFLKYAKLLDASQPRAPDLLDKRKQHYRAPGSESPPFLP